MPICSWLRPDAFGNVRSAPCPSDGVLVIGPSNWVPWPENKKGYEDEVKLFSASWVGNAAPFWELLIWTLEFHALVFHEMPQ